jgi:hypothetical protein
MKATDILKKAKKAIIDHIKYETMLIDTAVNIHHDAEEPAYTTEEDWPYSPSVSILVDNSCFGIEDDTYESRKVVKVSVEDNEKVVIEIEGGIEINPSTLDAEELEGICNCLETSYKKLIAK